jgi:hypothetical protein
MTETAATIFCPYLSYAAEFLVSWYLAVHMKYSATMAVVPER